MFLWNYDISTNAGFGVAAMNAALYGGKVCSYSIPSRDFHNKLAHFNTEPMGYKNKFISTWQNLFKNILTQDLAELENLNLAQLKMGVILATTKGHLEDYIWLSPTTTTNISTIDCNATKNNNFEGNNLETVDSESSGEAKLSAIPEDPGAVLLQNVLKHVWPKIIPAPQISASISQACSSSHIAFEIAKNWLNWGKADFVFVLAGDLIGPFVSKGFASLRLMATEMQRPFDKKRDGLFLGDAIGLALVSKHQPKRPCIEFAGLSNYTEGAVTRPSLTGDCLLQALQNLSLQKLFLQNVSLQNMALQNLPPQNVSLQKIRNDCPNSVSATSPHYENSSADFHNNLTKNPQPDFIIAHGTGTKFNDLAEDRALSRYLQDQKLIPITGTKWCLGHSLGASGMVDIIAAAEILRTQNIFTIATSSELDPQLQLQNYNFKAENQQNVFNNVFKEAIVTSLGFGGVHAAAWLKKRD